MAAPTPPAPIEPAPSVPLVPPAQPPFVDSPPADLPPLLQSADPEPADPPADDPDVDPVPADPSSPFVGPTLTDVPPASSLIVAPSDPATPLAGPVDFADFAPPIPAVETFDTAIGAADEDDAADSADADAPPTFARPASAPPDIDRTDPAPIGLAMPAPDLASPTTDLATPTTDLATPTTDLAMPAPDLVVADLAPPMDAVPELATPTADLAMPAPDLAVADLAPPVDAVPVPLAAPDGTAARHDAPAHPLPGALTAPVADEPALDAAVVTAEMPALAPTMQEPAVADRSAGPGGPGMIAPPSSDWVSPSKKKPTKRRRTPSTGIKHVGVAVLLGALGLGGLYASQRLAGDDTTPVVPAPVESTPAESTPAESAPADVEDAAQLPVSPDAATDPTSDIGIIADANDIVAEINDNDEEIEALELLDLDPVGPFAAAPDAVIFDGDEIADGTASVSDAQSYSFSWSYPAGTSITAWIDASTGDFQMTTAANHVLRSVDGLLYEQAVPGGQWSLSPLQEFADRSFVGRDRLITMPSMLPEEMLAFATVSEIGEDGFGSYLIDDVAFHRENPQLRSDWLTIWGFDASVVPTESTDAEGVMPDAAGPGQILVHTEGGLDSVVTTATVSTPAGTSTYVLLEASRDERALTVPELG